MEDNEGEGRNLSDLSTSKSLISNIQQFLAKLAQNKRREDTVTLETIC